MPINTLSKSSPTFKRIAGSYFFPCTLIIFLLFSEGCKNDHQAMQIDHVILAINDLEKGIEEFEELTGVEVTQGGQHKDSFTQNAIVSLGSHTYIEILAPSSDLDSIPGFFKQMNTLTPIGFALSVSSLAALDKHMQDINFKSNGIEDWSRVNSAGQELKWKLLRVEDPAIDINPFFIQWNDIHPSDNINSRCSLFSLELSSPHTDDIKLLLDQNLARTLNLHLIDGDSTRLRLHIKSPDGIIVFE